MTNPLLSHTHTKAPATPRDLSKYRMRCVYIHTQVTSILLDIGLCALTLGRMEEAEVLYKRALAIESEHLGADHPDAQATARALELFVPTG